MKTEHMKRKRAPTAAERLAYDSDPDDVDAMDVDEVI